MYWSSCQFALVHVLADCAAHLTHIQASPCALTHAVLLLLLLLLLPYCSDATFMSSSEKKGDPTGEYTFVFKN
jgi:hypothetical protein